MSKINVLILGISYFEGMAGSMRVRNLIEPLVEKREIKVSNLNFIKGVIPEKTEGVEENIRYKKLHLDERSLKSVFSFIYKGCSFIRKRKQKNEKNILYNYDSPDLKTIPLILYAKFIGYKIVYDIVEDHRYVTNYSGFANKLRVKTSRGILKATPYIADSVIAISRHLEERMKSLCKNKVPVTLIPVTVNFKFFSDGFKEPSDRVKIFYGGSFGEKDGLKYLIRGFEMAARANPNLVLVLTGKGEVTNDFKEIMAMIDASDCKKQIDYKGYLGTAAYYGVLNECDIFCMTRNNTVYANAGFPFKLGEFLASGKAVIATTVGDVPMYLKDGVNALLVPPESAEAIAAAINRVVANPHLVKQLGTEAKKTAQHYFDSGVLSRQVYQILENT